MVKGGKFGFKGNTRRGVSLKEQGSDESDEDYNVGADEEIDESDDCSFDGDESEVSLGKFEYEEVEDEEEEEEEEEEEMKVRKVAKPKGRRSFPGRKENPVMKPEKRKRVSYKEEEDDDDYEDDDDDEEFKPDEIDYEDDEDDLSVKEKNKNVGRPFVREKGFARGRKRKRNGNCKVQKKPTRKKPKKSRRLVMETSSGDDDGELTGKNLVVEERSKKVSGRRRRKYKPHSDSDFVSSGSSDYEYTISEEEREQVREANKVCTSLTTSLRTSKRLHEEVPRQQLKLPGRKGKEKVVEELKNEAGKRVCGICLTEEGKKTVRGTLNCCDHYFCFPCIMEWSKVESRCPLCKQRFVTIDKSARSNTSFDLRTMVIHVPERDQVYQPSEEELRGYLDPYESVICTECHQGGDDSLMLLCDVCDSPAHTYCVGLGREVPAGNWYCEGCRPTAFGSLNPQGPSPTPDRRANSNLSGVSSSTVYNVGEGIDLNVSYVPDTPLTQENGVFSSARRAVGDFHAGSPAFGSGANTVSERRRIRLMFPNLLDHSDGRSNGVSTTSSGTRLFGYQLDREIARQRTITPENNTPFVHSRDVVSSGLGHLSGRGQHPTSTSGINMEFNPGSNYEPLPPFNSISVVGSDASTSLYACREGTATPRASQGAVHTPF